MILESNLPRMIIIRQTHTEPIKVRDAETEDTACLNIYVNAGPSDNPMQSEISGHIGAKGNFFCRKCQAGGTGKDKETDECFHSLFEVSLSCEIGVSICDHMI